MASQCVVWRRGGRGTGGLAYADGDRLTVGQGNDNRRAGDWCADSGGVGDVATFSCRLCRRQFHSGGVDGVGDVGHCRYGARHQVLEVAARCSRDRRFNLAGVFVDIIGWRWNGHGASGFAGVDGNHGAVGQGHGDWRAGSVGQCSGVDDRAALSHRTGRSQRQVGGVDGVGHGGADRCFVGHEIFVVAASDTRDRVGQRRLAGQRIVRCGEGYGAGGFADFDGDVLAVCQGHDNRRAGHRPADSGGVSDGAAFSYRRISREFDG
ncbi:hypothetical protein D3C87_1334720 [compost metagenome]